MSEVLPEEMLQPLWRHYLGLPEGGYTLYGFEKNDLDIYLLAHYKDGVKTSQLVILRKPPPPELPKPTWRHRLGAWIHG